MSDGGADQSPRLRIGQVRDELLEEFPDLSISKLRFLEDKGLVMPVRSAGRYRLYSAADVEQIRSILRLQRDEFLPLRVIRDQLRRRLDEPPVETVGTADDAGVPPASTVPAPAGADELAAAAGVPAELVQDCRVLGLVPSSGPYVAEDVAVVRQCGRLARFGLGVRHLRQVAAAARSQASLPGHYADVRTRHGSGDVEATRAAEALAEDLLDLVIQLYRAEVRRQLAAGPARPPEPSPHRTDRPLTAG